MIFQPFQEGVSGMVTLQNAIAHFGVEIQQVVTIEEMAELTQQISKMVINHPKKNRQNLVEEFSDVLIMLCQIKIIYSITQEEVESIQLEKLKKISNRIAKEMKEE